MKIKLDPGAFMPERAYAADAGFDLRAPKGLYFYALPAFIGCAVIDTGVHVQIPEGYVGMLKSRSGMNVNHGILNEGVIDSGYTGSIRVKLYNHGDKPYIVNPGDKISQLVIVPVFTPELELVDKLEETDRGDNGFGSSGRM